MKKVVITLLGISAITLLSTVTALAASLTLTNGGLGQVVANPTQFGVAVCAGNADLTQSVPITVAVNGQTSTVSSASPIPAGTCQYSYLNYADLGMQSDQTYAVSVTIDPQQTVVSSTNNQTTYSITVPTQPSMAVATSSNNLTANIASQFANPFLAVWNWLSNLFHSL